MDNIDKNNRLKEECFSYKVSKDNKVFIYWYGKQVIIIKGKDSEKFLAKIENADAMEAQLIMAKLTGNFKRGNEKISKRNNQRGKIHVIREKQENICLLVNLEKLLQVG